jgi:hypothetical protein
MNKFQIALAAASLAAGAATARADELRLRDGSLIEGEVVRETPLELEVQGKYGSTTIRRCKVESVIVKPTAERMLLARRAELAPGDVVGRLELAELCRSRKLVDEAAKLALEAFALDPKSVDAREELEELGFHFSGGSWLAPDRFYPARGFVKKGDAWVTPEQAAARDALAAAGHDLALAAEETTKAQGRAASARARVRSLEADLAVLERQLAAARAQVPPAERNLAAAERHLDDTRAMVVASIDPCVGITREQQDLISSAECRVRAVEKALAAAEAKVRSVEDRLDAKAFERDSQAAIAAASEASPVGSAPKDAVAAARERVAAADRTADERLRLLRTESRAALEDWLESR